MRSTDRIEYRELHIVVTVLVSLVMPKSAATGKSAFADSPEETDSPLHSE
jgi:hypothetical protein